MPATPHPLTAKQRQTATKAARAQKLAEKHTVLAAARATRDELLTALVVDGVRPFVVTNETGCPARLPEQIARRVKAAAKATAKRGGRK